WPPVLHARPARSQPFGADPTTRQAQPVIHRFRQEVTWMTAPKYERVRPSIEMFRLAAWWGASRITRGARLLLREREAKRGVAKKVCGMGVCGRLGGRISFRVVVWR